MRCSHQAWSGYILGLAAAVGFAGSAQATTITFSDFSDTSGLTIVGSAGTPTTGDGTVLRVTPASASQAGGAYSTSAITLGTNATFSTQFQFRFSNPGGVDPADGITFVLAKSASGLGAAGYGMGYAGVGNSVAIEFDTYNNGILGSSLGYFAAEPNSSNHVAIDLNGALTNTAAANVYGNGSCGFTPGTPSQNDNTVAGCMSNGDLWTVDISYDGASQLLNVSLTDPAKGSAFSAMVNYAIDISSYLGTNTAYVGFTGSTGAGWANQDIVNWRFANTYKLPSLPEPGTLALAGLGLTALRLQRSRRATRSREARRA